MRLQNKKRTKYEIVYLILKAINEGGEVTEETLVLRTNLGRKTLDRYITKLSKAGLIKQTNNTFTLTEQGEKALKILELTRELEKELNEEIV